MKRPRPQPDPNAALQRALDASGQDDPRWRAVQEAVESVAGLLTDGGDLGQLRLVRTALDEMRRTYRLFNQYRGVRKVSIFGSARTPSHHPDYLAARDFGRLMASHGWMAITGAGDGIMKAGHEGPSRESSFGLGIRLPFESRPNDIIQGDDKLIEFRYFFTRKLMFLSQSDAVAVFPGGFGTHDELFETLTLVQTGRSHIMPIVLVEGLDADGTSRGYWHDWQEFVRDELLRNGWISPEDMALFRIVQTPQEAVDEVLRFYRRYHSSRYVRDNLVIRLNAPLPSADLQRIAAEFRPLFASGTVEQREALSEERGEHGHLTRLVFHHTRRDFGMLRRLIDRLNDVPLDPAT
ncbi:MAG: hypothetical protein RJA05_75 [Planctomycetota bacterium]|jgi:uncharacterized protein (TIGR00730 family)